MNKMGALFNVWHFLMHISHERTCGKEKFELKCFGKFLRVVYV